MGSCQPHYDLNQVFIIYILTMCHNMAAHAVICLTYEILLCGMQ